MSKLRRKLFGKFNANLLLAVGALSVGAGIFFALGANASIGSNCQLPTDYKYYPGVGRACLTRSGLYQFFLSDGTLVMTHGPDEFGEPDDIIEKLTKLLFPPPQCRDGEDNDSDGLIDHSSVNSDNPDPGCTSADDDNEYNEPPPPPPRPIPAPEVCADAGDYYNQVLYLLPSGSNHSEYKRVDIADMVLAADDELYSQGSKRFKFLCDEEGRLSVTNVTIPHDTVDFQVIINDLKDQGYDKSLAHYAIWYEKAHPSFRGQGSMYHVDTAGVNNPNNKGPAWSISYAQTGEWGVLTILHELSHNMGAIQRSAPNSDGGAHCTDGPELMCPKLSHHNYIDSGRNDYFNPSPPAGSYLYNFWNWGADYNNFIKNATN